MIPGIRSSRSGLIDVWIRVQSSYWFVPLLLVLLAFLLSYLMVAIDGRIGDEWVRNVPWLFVNQPAGARAVLATVAGSMITVAGVTFSMTLLLVSHASAQIGPRLLTGFMKDRGNQFTLGVFLATFVYCLLVLRSVRTGDGGDIAVEFVPHLAVAVGIALALGSVFVLIYFIHHAPQTLNIANVVSRLGSQICDRIDQMFPETLAEAERATGAGDEASEGGGAERAGSEADRIVRSTEGNSYLRVLDLEGLFSFAEACDVCIEVLVQPGFFTLRGDPLLRVHSYGRAESIDDDELRDFFSWGIERTPEQDVRYLLDQLNEIAGRALSPGINDPLTAMACIDQLAAAISRLGKRQDPEQHWQNEAGVKRLLLKTQTCVSVLDLALVPMRQFVAGDAMSTVHLLDMIGRCVRSALSDAITERLLHHADVIRGEALECLPTGAQKARMILAFEAAQDRGAGR